MDPQPAASLRHARPAGRWCCSPRSWLAFIDSTVVNIALPAIGWDLRADAAGL